MRFGLYSVLDVNLGYGMPVVQENDAVAMRNFDNVCRDVNSVYHTHLVISLYIALVILILILEYSKPQNIGVYVLLWICWYFRLI